MSMLKDITAEVTQFEGGGGPGPLIAKLDTILPGHQILVAQGAVTYQGWMRTMFVYIEAEQTLGNANYVQGALDSLVQCWEETAR